ncbi:MAG: MFS transporter [Candidatus Nanopelagicales bacterium]
MSENVTSAPDPGRWRALTICLAGGFMVLLDVSIVNVALPAIREGIGASASDLQWIISGYALAFGLILVPAGRLGDMRGRRRMFVIGLVVFTLSSAVCGAAQDSGWLVGARLVQGLGGGILTPQITAFIQELFAGRERGVAFGAFGSMVGIATAIGPVLGGALIQIFGATDGWRWVFYINVPIGVVLVPVAMRMLPGHDRDTGAARHDLDLIGVGLFGAGTVALLLPLIEFQEWSAVRICSLIAVAVLLLAAFVVREHRYAAYGHEPLLDLSLFRIRSYAFGTSMITIYFAGFVPLFFVFTLYLQTGLGYSALGAGLAILPFALGSGAAAALGGRIVGRYGRPLVVLGLVVVAVGYAGSLVAIRIGSPSTTAWLTALPLLVAGIGSGLVIAPNQTLTLSEVPVPQAGSAGGLMQTGQRIGTAVGVAAVGTLFFGRVADSRGQDWTGAYQVGIVVAIGFVLVALVVAVMDVVLDGGSERPATQGRQPSQSAARRVQ